MADDAAVIGAVVARALNERGHTLVGRAESASAALELYERERPDVMLIDSRLPPDGACALVTSLRERDADARLLVIAAVSEIDVVRRAVEAGARGAVRRPLERDDLLDALVRAGA